MSWENGILPTKGLNNGLNGASKELTIEGQGVTIDCADSDPPPAGETIFTTKGGLGRFIVTAIIFLAEDVSLVTVNASVSVSSASGTIMPTFQLELQATNEYQVAIPANLDDAVGTSVDELTAIVVTLTSPGDGGTYLVRAWCRGYYLGA